MSTPQHGELTPTSYAMLGLLALRPWTTYELAKQMQRSVRWFWPRAERKLYDEPKRLAALGLATFETTTTGRRRSTVYQITTAGRRALRAWLRAGPGAPMQVEMEAMIRVFFADGASLEDLRATLAAVGDQASETLLELGELAAGTLSAEDDFPERRATNAIALELWVRLHETVCDWSTWAQDEVQGWPPGHPTGAPSCSKGSSDASAAGHRPEPQPDDGLADASADASHRVRALTTLLHPLCTPGRVRTAAVPSVRQSTHDLAPHRPGRDQCPSQGEVVSARAAVPPTPVQRPPPTQTGRPGLLLVTDR